MRSRWRDGTRRRRMVGSVGPVLLIVVGIQALIGGAPAGAATGFGSTWPVYHENSIGTGVDTSGTDLSPATAAWTSAALDGQLYGEPLVEAGRVFVATENDTVYALAADSGAVLWQAHVGTPVASSQLPCGDISPSVGITSTPVIDEGRGEIFVVADEAAGGGAAHHLVGLDIFTGAVLLDQVVDPPGSVPLDQLQRAGLALDGSEVVIGFGGNDGDCGTYNGWLVAVPERGGAMSTFAVATLPGDSKGAVWMGGGAPAVDGSGHIWIATGNSTYSSSSDAYDDSDGVIELTSGLSVVQYFAPSNWYADNGADRDLGSSSPAFIGNGLVLQAGKSQTAYVMAQGSLGGVGGQQAEATSFCGNNVDGGSAVSGSVVYSPCLSGIVATTVAAGSPPTITADWKTSTGATGPPVVAGGLVWSINPSSGTLYGLSPSTGASVQSLPIGSEANHFPTPAVADGLLLAPSSDQVHAFAGPAGLPPPPNAYWSGVAVAGTGGVVGAPGMALEPNGAPTAFVRDTSNRLINYYYVPSTGRFQFSTWADSGVGSDPAVAIEPNGAPTVFVRELDGSLDNYWYVPSTGAVDMTIVAGPGSVFSDPAVAIEPNAAPTVFVAGPGGSLENYWYVPSTGGFNGTVVAGAGSVTSAPAVALEPNGAPTVFAAGPGSSLTNYWYIPSAGTFGAVSVAGPGSVSSAPAVSIEPNAAPTVFATGPGASLANFWYIPSQGVFGSTTAAGAGTCYSVPSVAIEPNGAPTVFVAGAGGSLTNYWYVP